MKKILLVLYVLLSTIAFAQQTNNQGLTIVAQQSVDGKQYKTINGRHAPYSNTVDFLASVVATRRHVGQIAYIYNGLSVEVWQFTGGIADNNLVKILPVIAGNAFDTIPIYIRLNQNSAQLASKQANLVSGVNSATLNGLSLLGPNNIVITGASSKALYRDITTTVGSVTVWNFDSSSTAKITTSGTVNIDITGTIPTGSTGVLLVTQSASGNDSLKYNGVQLNIAKVANKTSLVGFVKLATTLVFSIDTTSATIAQTGSVVVPGDSFDPDATALFTAATTNTSFKAAVNNAIIALKGITLAAGGTAWSKSVMINGRAGTNLTQQSFNWRNPAQYNYIYNNAFVFSPNGTQFNGTNYIQTGLIPLTAFTGTTSDISIVNVVGANPTPGGILLGTSGTNGGTYYTAAYSPTAWGYLFNTGQEITATSTGATGRFITFYTNPTTLNSYRNGTLLDSRATAPGTNFANVEFYEGALNNNGTALYLSSPRIDVTQVINAKLTVAEAQAIDAVWATYQSALSR